MSDTPKEVEQPKRSHVIPRRNWILIALSAARNDSLNAVKLQKTLFLLGQRRAKEVGQSYYRFRAYHYGPFSAEIYDDAATLARDGLLELDLSRGHSMRRYVLTDEGRQEAESAAALAPRQAVEYLTDVVAWAEPLSFNTLVRAVYEEFPEMRANSIFPEIPVRSQAPYPWCRQPDICSKKGYCQRDPNCGE